MPEPLSRVWVIALTELKFRFRRVAAVVTLLIVAAAVYFIVPDVSTGRALLQIHNARVSYTSAAVALGTGMFCALLLSLIGFYIVSNSYRRDILTRTGFVVAATPVTNTQYVLGKFLGNSLYLGALTLTCMVSSMVMFLIRGEGGLEIGTFLAIYAWIMIPSIAFCAGIALAFEGVPFLAGRFGDVLFFFVWAALLGLPAAMTGNDGTSFWLGTLDIAGVVPVIGYLRDHFHTTSISIGSSTFDPTQAPVLLDGFRLDAAAILQRALTLAPPFGFLLLARSWFHRFNPVRIKFTSRQGRRGPWGRINRILKPAARLLVPVRERSGAAAREVSFAQAVRADVRTTLLLSPVVMIAVIVFAVISLSVTGDALREGVLPAIALAVIVSLADVASRDDASGTIALLYTAPRLRRQYVLWKLCSALAVTFAFTLIPLLRLTAALPNAALSLLIGSVFTACAATACGIMTNSGKLFTALFLMLLYIALNAKGVPALDFVGMEGTATTGVQVSYALLSAGLIAGALVRHKHRLAL